MKKVIVLLAVMTAVFALPAVHAVAKSGDVIGNVYSTDILTLFNDVPVPSYNIGGKTAIILEDLVEYGVSCYYSEDIRTLIASINSPLKRPPLGKRVDRGEVGKIVGKVYETDITTYVNGLQINAYALNGKMAVAIEDLGEITDAGMEYSPYNMRCVWNADARTISLYFLYGNYPEIYGWLNERSLYLTCENDKVTVHSNPFFNRNLGNSFPDDESLPSYYPIYCGGKRVGTGFQYADLNVFGEGTSMVNLVKSFYNHYQYYDVDALKNVIENIDVEEPSYEEVLRYFTEEMYGTVVLQRVDTEVCTFLYISQGTPHGAVQFLVRIAKDGGYKNYAEMFASVSLYGTKVFDDVKIEGDTVTFSYDAYYAIDLTSGEMRKIQP